MVSLLRNLWTLTHPKSSNTKQRQWHWEQTSDLCGTWWLAEKQELQLFFLPSKPQAIIASKFASGKSFSFEQFAEFILPSPDEHIIRVSFKEISAAKVEPFLKNLIQLEVLNRRRIFHWGPFQLSRIPAHNSYFVMYQKIPI